MAAFLLDTHTLLWHSARDSRLSEKVIDRITDPQHSIFVSVASYWEMTIKASLGKLDLPAEVDVF